jgi:excisionase family DNA binding protein
MYLHYLSTENVARRLGVSPRTVRLWAELGELPAAKFGRQWRFEEHLLANWISKRNVLPSSKNGTYDGPRR